jgi:hypothetical protein
MSIGRCNICRLAHDPGVHSPLAGFINTYSSLTALRERVVGASLSLPGPIESPGASRLSQGFLARPSLHIRAQCRPLRLFRARAPLR